MTEKLPAGWSGIRLGDILLGIEAGKSFTCEPRRAEQDEWGVIKVSAMTWGVFREDENKALPAHRDPDPRHEIQPGDILVSRANTEAYVGAPVLVGDCRPRLLLSDKSLRLRPASGIDRRWLVYALASPTVRRQISAESTGAQESMRNISQRALANVQILLPPVEEQLRIVDALEGHMSRLDAVSATLEASYRRAIALTKRIIVDAVPIPGPAHWKAATVADAGEVDLGRQRHPDWHAGSNMHPYLRVANVFEDRIDASDVMEMDFPGDLFERFRLSTGDILLNEGQSPEYLGRPAMYRGDPENVAFTNSLLRFRATDGVDPEWALLVFRRHMHAGRFMEETRITTNIAHLSARRFKAVEFPIPPFDEQQQIVEATRELIARATRITGTVATARLRNRNLRKSLLEAAFTGRLVPQDAADEPVSLLLSRIGIERTGVVARPRRGTSKRARATKGVSVAVQGELEL